MSGRSPSGRATHASTEPASSLGHSVSVPNAWTPGPWSYCSCGCGFIGGGDDEVATVTIGKWGDEGVNIFTGKRELVHHWGTVPAERAHANARLIAAAPELYEAALEIIERRLPGTDTDRRERLKSAIRKAHAESPHNQSNPKVGA